MPRTQQRSNKYQFYSLWFEPIWAWTHDLPHSQGEHTNHYTTDAVHIKKIYFIDRSKRRYIIKVWIPVMMSCRNWHLTKDGEMAYPQRSICLACDKSRWRRDIGIVFTVASAWTMSSFHDEISFSITIQPKFTRYGPHIDHWGWACVTYLVLTIYWFKFTSSFSYFQTKYAHHIWSTL
jgi:hypothetical protein